MRVVFNRKRYLVLFVLVLGGLFMAFAPKKTDPKLFSSVTVGSVSDVVSSSGSVESGGVTAVYSPTNGVVKKIFVTDGQVVEKNQPLFEVSSTATAKEKSEALADLLAARVALKKAENTKETLQNSLETARREIIEAENTKKIFDENVVAQKPNPSTGRGYTEEEKLAMSSTMITTRKDFTNAEKEYLDATESIRSASASLAAANAAYLETQDSITKSPVAGKIANLKRQVGNVVDSEKEMLVVMSSTDLLVEIKVSEFNVGKIKIGQNAEVKFDAFPGEVVSGKVVGVDSVGNELSGTVSFEVLVSLTPTVEQAVLIRPAMTANLNIVTATKDNVMTVPRSAIKLEEGKYFVMVKSGSKTAKQEVELGVMGTDVVEVVSGLKNDDMVLTVFEEKK